MSKDTNEHAIAPSRSLGWLASAQRHARPLKRWIGQAAQAAPSEDWTMSKASRPGRRPVWE